MTHNDLTKELGSDHMLCYHSPVEISSRVRST